jgi:hypothetical protein
MPACSLGAKGDRRESDAGDTEASRRKNNGAKPQSGTIVDNFVHLFDDMTARMAREYSGCEVWQQDFLQLDPPPARTGLVFAAGSSFPSSAARANTVSYETLRRTARTVKRQSIGLAASLIVATPLHAAFASTCVPVQGKITNNFVSDSSTLGVVAMEYGTKSSAIKLKCALVGVQQPATAPADIHFIHTISCDDSLISLPAFDHSGDVPIHSSIVLDTTGNVLPPQRDNELFRFKETSVPIVGVGARGVFYGVSGGQLLVDGVVYKSPLEGIPGSIDMKFSGQACF